MIHSGFDAVWILQTRAAVLAERLSSLEEAAVGAEGRARGTHLERESQRGERADGRAACSGEAPAAASSGGAAPGDRMLPAKRTLEEQAESGRGSRAPEVPPSGSTSSGVRPAASAPPPSAKSGGSPAAAPGGGAESGRGSQAPMAGWSQAGGLQACGSDGALAGRGSGVAAAGSQPRSERVAGGVGSRPSSFHVSTARPPANPGGQVFQLSLDLLA